MTEVKFTKFTVFRVFRILQCRWQANARGQGTAGMATKHVGSESEAADTVPNIRTYLEQIGKRVPPLTESMGSSAFPANLNPLRTFRGKKA
ncbi:MAG TPA: hypothetical protein VEZ41_00800 [Allosphingosinicella sp.]|nr:hypothetical protein [Allosphingosinicella sp.]